MEPILSQITYSIPSHSISLTAILLLSYQLHLILELFILIAVRNTIMKLLVTTLYPAFHHLLPPRSKYVSQQPVLKTP
jgi:hypothetical protein